MLEASQICEIYFYPASVSYEITPHLILATGRVCFIYRRTRPGRSGEEIQLMHVAFKPHYFPAHIQCVSFVSAISRSVGFVVGVKFKIMRMVYVFFKLIGFVNETLPQTSLIRKPKRILRRCFFFISVRNKTVLIQQ